MEKKDKLERRRYTLGPLACVPSQSLNLAVRRILQMLSAAQY
jgi:hypothetical protein